MLELQALRAGYAPGVAVLQDVELHARPGEIVALVGESGSGKSTIVKVLLGLLPGHAWVQGSARFSGTELIGRAERDWKGLRGKRIGIVPQGAMGGLNPVRRVEGQLVEAVRLHTGVSRAAARARARELVTLVHLEPRVLTAYPHQLSGGMRQRVAIGLALAGEPALLVADEPTTGLDPRTQERVLDLLGELRGDRTLLVISHDLPAVRTIADRIAVLSAGRIVEHQSVGPEEPVPRHRVPREPVVQVSGVRVTFALRDVSLAIEPGEILGLAGESGAGKTTLARVMLGLLTPAAGHVQVGDDVLTSLRGKRLREARHRIGFVHQDPYGALHPAMTVRQLVSEPLDIIGRPRTADRIATALESAGLSTELLDRLPATLSGGQRQRVAIARAIVADPILLIADEATSMLDAATRAGITATLRRLAGHGLAVLLITHDLAEAEHTCDRIAVLHNGTLSAT